MAAKGPTKEHYATLGLSCAATELEVKQAYYRLAREHHPDHNYGDPEAAERFKEVQMAYEALVRRFAKPKLAKPKPRKSEQFPFVDQSSSRLTMSRLGAWACCGLLMVAAAAWSWSRWQAESRLAESRDAASSLQLAEEPSPKPIQNSQPTDQPSASIAIASGMRDPSVSPAYDEVDDNHVDSSIDLANAEVQFPNSLPAFEEGSSSDAENEASVYGRHSSEGLADLIERESSVADTWSLPAATSTSFDPLDLDALDDLDVTDPHVWHGYMETLNRTSSKAQTGSNPASDYGRGLVFESEIGFETSGTRKYAKPVRSDPPEFSYGKKSSPSVAGSQVKPSYRSSTSSTSTFRNVPSAIGSFSIADEKLGLGLPADQGLRGLPSRNGDLDLKHLDYGHSLKEFGQAGDQRPATKPGSAISPGVDLGTTRYAPGLDLPEGVHWNGAARDQQQLKPRAQKRNVWKPDSNPIHKHKRNLPSYSSKAPSKLKELADQAKRRQESQSTKRNYLSPTF